MKRLFILCTFTWAVFQAKAQTVFDTTFTSYPDSGYHVVHDSIPDSTAGQKIAHIFAPLDTEYISTGILIDRAIPLANYQHYVGDTTDSLSKYATVLALMETLNMGAVDTSSLPFPLPDPYNTVANGYLVGGNDPIAIIAAKYNMIDSFAVDSGLLSITGRQLFDVPGRPRSPYLSKLVFSAAPFISVLNSPDANFVVGGDMLETNLGAATSIIIDFGDGSGPHTMTPGTPVHIHFPAGDSAKVSPFIGAISISFSGFPTLHSHFIVNVQGQVFDQYGFQAPVTWTIPASSGRHSGGTVTVALGCGNTKLTKPLIFVKGFDPMNSYHYSYSDYGFLYDLKNYGHGALNNEFDIAGYDLVFVDYNNDLDSIERNARYLEDVINRVNDTLAAHGSHEKNVVVGVSMGGLVARWCLKTMENEHAANPSLHPRHRVKEFISFDAPQRGAYVPLSVQYMVEQMNKIKLPVVGHLSLQITENGDFPLIDMYKALTSPAASEMLIVQAKSVAGDNPIFTDQVTYSHGSFFNGTTPFLSTLRSMGDPSDSCRNVAIASGSQTAQDQGYGGSNVLMASLSGGFATIGFLVGIIPSISFTMKSLPDRGSGMSSIYSGNYSINELAFNITIKVSDVEISIQNSDPLENVPGGVYDINQFGNGSESITQEIEDNASDMGLDCHLYHTAFAFVPTVSALDIQAPQSNDPFYNVQAGNIVVNNYTLFKRYVAPDSTRPAAVYPNVLHAQFDPSNQSLFESELSLISIHINSPDTAFIFRDTSYNFGSNTSAPYQTIDRIGNTEFLAGTSLLINADSALGLSTSGNPHPTHGSNFDVSTAGANCGGSVNVTIDAGGRMIMGDSIYGNTGTFYVDSADYLEIDGGLKLNPGCHIIVENGGAIGIGTGITPTNPIITLDANSSIVVKKGGVFYSQLGTINLNDTSANIEIDGTLDISYASTFSLSPTSTGYVKFYQSVSDDGTINITDYGSFYLSGTSSSHKILEVDGGGSIYPEDYQTMFHIDHGAVALGSGSRLNIGSPLQLEHIKINSNTGSYNGHRGLNIYGQSSVFIDSVSITNGDYGVYAPLFFEGHGVTFHNLYASGYDMAVYTDGGTVAFNDTCNLALEGGDGWEADELDGGSFERSKLAGAGGYGGINVNGSYGGAPVYMGQSEINNSSYGCNSDNCAVTIDTSKINWCTPNLEGSDDAVFNICPTNGGGYSDLSDGSPTISISDGTELYLNGGFNNLTPNGGSSINASLSYCPGFNVSYNSNLWNVTGTAPIPGSYSTSAPCSPFSFYNIYDSFPLSVTTWDTAYSPYYNGPTSISPTFLIDNEFDQFKINNAALKQQIYDGMIAAQIGQYQREASLFNQCVNQYIAAGHPDDELLHRMYNKTIEGVHKSINDKQMTATNPLVDSVIATQDLMRNSLQSSDEYFLRFIATLDKSGLKRAQNNRPEALQILEDLETWADTSRLKHIQYMHCVINAEQEVLSGAVPKEKFQALVKNCVRDVPHLSEPNKQVINATTSVSEISTPVIYPNPAGSSFNISLNSQGSSELNITISDVNGRIVCSYLGMALTDGQNIVSYPVNNLLPGVYFAHLVYNGKDFREKIVVQNE